METPKQNVSIEAGVYGRQETTVNETETRRPRA
jgi:hypothetical protein